MIDIFYLSEISTVRVFVIQLYINSITSYNTIIIKSRKRRLAMKSNKNPPDTTNKASPPEEENTPVSSVYDTLYEENYTSTNAASLNDNRPDIGTKDLNYRSYNSSDEYGNTVINRQSYKNHIIRDEDLDLDDEL
jgi:hypothetical protein